MNDDIVIGNCPICRRNVYFMESHFVESGIDYHESCFVKHLCIRKAKLENKKSKGSITLDEANDLLDTDKMLINATATNTGTTKYSQKRKYDELICRPLIREECKRSTIDKKFKILEESRRNRWAWESFNIIENMFLIGEGNEKKQITDGRNDTMQT